jgi:hypothetical protein
MRNALILAGLLLVDGLNISRAITNADEAGNLVPAVEPALDKGHEGNAL